MRRATSTLGGCALATRLGAAEAKYPDRAIKLVVPFAPGGVNDQVARLWAEYVKSSLGTVYIENQGGAGGAVGALAVAHAPPDGYTILFGTNGTLGIGPALYKNLRYDPVHDLAPVGLLHKLPLLLIVNPRLHAQNLAELLIYARANPGKLTFASAGVGSTSHMAGERFRLATNIDVRHIPFRENGLTEVMAGRIDFYFIPLAAAAGALAGGTNNPSTSFSMTSGTPVIQVATHGSSIAMASINTTGTPSRKLDRTKASLDS